MTMFERDFVERLESVIGWKPISESHSIADAILNEFMRLNKRIAELEQEGADKDEYIVRTGITILSKLDEPLKALEEFKNRITKLEELLDIVDDKKQTVFEILTNTIARRDKRIEELEQERRWIPVEELSETIRALVYMGNDYTVIATYHKNTDKWKNDCGAIVENAIKYQPLPQPPSEEE